ncbi:hypothetical protein [Burkholderia sp. ABCPW 14]|nr:hypothetical protein [Burkholderia sp. ABCPW 14]
MTKHLVRLHEGGRLLQKKDESSKPRENANADWLSERHDDAPSGDDISS